jgi:hypothetical protein
MTGYGDQEVGGSNPRTIYWMDVSNLLAITFKEKLKIKIAKWGTPKKYIFLNFKNDSLCSLNLFE